jgi:two-component system phosphate regulon sensor histidine kinase PhoR
MPEFGQQMAQRLYDARYILVAAALLALLLSLAGRTEPWQAVAGLCLVAAAACLPINPRAAGRRERLSRKIGGEPLESVVFATCEALDDPAFILSSGGGLKYQNRAAVDQFGPMPADAHVSARLRAPDILDMVDRAMTTGQTLAIEHVERVPSERWYRVRIAPMKEIAAMKGGGELYILTFRDHSEARRIDKMRTDFIANASHELRTPLASLSGFVETMQGPARDDPKAREQFLGIMHEQAGRMTRLLDDLLSLSRLEMKAHMVPTETVDLQPLVEHVIDTLQPLAEDLGVKVRFLGSDQPVVVPGDRDELIQVFENLIENACKYGQSGKRVDVAITGGSDIDGSVEVSVADHGPGIPKEHVPRLTERFYRVNVEASRSQKGTGLGLAIVKHILTRHRARLIIRSEPGKGSKFLVRFGD